VQAKGEHGWNLYKWRPLLTWFPEMQTRMQEILPGCSKRTPLHRSYTRIKDSLHIRKLVHRMWYLPKEMPVWGYQYYQSADKPRNSGHPSLLREQLQASSTAHA
jgi:hypothetical protein